jgi:Secretion system C-terminal sorting domain
MKTHYNFSIYFYLLTFVLFSMSTFSQCVVNYANNGASVSSGSGFLWGQSFIAECSGDLEYVQFTSSSPGATSGGTLKIYNGNSVTTPIYTQAFSAITITNVGDPVRINITGSVPVVLNNQYTFEFPVDNISVLVDFAAGYTNGSAWEDGVEAATVDFLFSASIATTLGIDDIDKVSGINIYPNPSSDFVVISGLENIAHYTIFDILGKETLSGSIANNEKINIQNLNSGMYFLRLENDVTTKFIKK